jgi:hypothetical protein
LRVHAAIEVSTVKAYNARLRGLSERLQAELPKTYRNLELLGGRFPEKRYSYARLVFEPQCPRVEIAIHALHARQAEPTSAELNWAERRVRRFGEDYVTIYTEAVGEEN